MRYALNRQFDIVLRGIAGDEIDPPDSASEPAERRLRAESASARSAVGSAKAEASAPARASDGVRESEGRSDSCGANERSE
jgi:hypothetical protein